MERGFPSRFSYFLHQLETVQHTQDITRQSYGNYCRIGRSIYPRNQSLLLSHSLQLRTQTQRSVPHCLMSGQIFASLFANFICASAGPITGNLHCAAAGLTFGRTKYETLLQVSKSSKSFSCSCFIDVHKSNVANFT